MKSFRHHPDGVIFIDNDFQCTLEEFLIFEPDYILEEGFIGREYIKDSEFFGETINRLYTKRDEFITNFDWEEGEVYISKKLSYIVLLNELRGISA